VATSNLFSDFRAVLGCFGLLLFCGFLVFFKKKATSSELEELNA